MIEVVYVIGLVVGTLLLVWQWVDILKEVEEWSTSTLENL